MKSQLELMYEIRYVMSRLKPEDRIEFLREIREGYCRFCGYPENTKERPGQCQCSNDE